MRIATIALPLLVGLLGCGSPKQPPFQDLHPVTGVVMENGKTVSGGAVQFSPEPETPEFMINSEVGADGSFTLTTVRSTDRKGERKPGAPAGQYRVTYIPVMRPPTAGPPIQPIQLPQPVSVNAGTNHLTLEIPPH